MPNTTLYKWEEISKVPAEPGVYAWYYSPEITERDLNIATEKINSLKSQNHLDEARQYTSTFLDKFVFRYFKEDSYKVILHAALKPQYKGSVDHSEGPSQSLIDRIVEEPGRLITIKEILKEAAPYFSSPIYIGMSDQVGQRLMSHKNLIQRYREKQITEYTAEAKEHSFAQQVCARSIPPACLFVMVRLIESPRKDYVDAENILNRINYPILGRN